MRPEDLVKVAITTVFELALEQGYQKADKIYAKSQEQQNANFKMNMFKQDLTHWARENNIELPTELR